ncbi:MAG TPA: M14 family metallopeptidase [Vicinamibacterales bacterium]
MPSTPLTVGSITAQPGEKRYGINEFPIDGKPYRLPMWLVNGRGDGPTLVVTAGVHPAEYASIAAALEVAQTLDPKSLRGSVIVVPVMNLPALTARSIYVCPLDGKNLNRVFPGDAGGTASEQIAAWVFDNVIKRADYYIDLHGGDLIEALVPFTIFHKSGDAGVDAASVEMAKAFGIPILVSSETQGGTYSSASKAGVPSILTEAGGQGIWKPDAVKAHTQGIARVMRHLKMRAGGAPKTVRCRVLARFLWLRSDHDGFWYPSVAVGARVRKGQELGRLTDWEGRVLQKAISPAAGRVLFIVSSLAINNTDPLLAVGA